MALKKDMIEERFGATIPGAYCKLCYVSWSDQDKRVMATLSFWASPTAEAEGKEALCVKPYDVTDLFPNFQADIYESIKVLPEYDGSTDV